ncbi:MAG: copper homeostasis protein CutC [Candidatus Cloacimonadaceae bacterium]|nr:copper homeostasis protein CutC [Candidatus Cloacimonadota bacterium]MDD3533168.1 copper homeostasis protein CutC [Candidatus Cloacimonadota bacterium]MDY0128274.1 copper homeostasis protein CutC [Candidatus Cloacimonadaceae bacterium]
MDSNSLTSHRPESLLEICTDSADTALAAESAGADRIELCCAIESGGLSPSYGCIKRCVELLKIPVNVLIRPRGGDFCYSENDFLQMMEDIAISKAAGAQGIVSGVLNPDGSVDTRRTKLLIKHTQPLSFTFHRAFDLSKDPYRALEDIIRCGASRLLSSGQQVSAEEGLALLCELAALARNRIIIMPGAGIDAQSIAKLLAQNVFTEYHMTARTFSKADSSHRIQSGLSGRDPIAQEGFWRTDIQKINSVKQRMNS